MSWSRRAAGQQILKQWRFCGDPRGMAWSGPVDPFGLDLLDALDGVRPAAAAVLAAAAEHGVEPEDALAAAVPVLGQLAVEGFVL